MSRRILYYTLQLFKQAEASVFEQIGTGMPCIA